MVGIDGDAVALYFPVSRHLDVGPLDIGSRLFDARWKILVSIHIVEVPGSVQQLVVRAAGLVQSQGISAVVIRHEGCSSQFSIHADSLDVFPVRQCLLCPCGCGYTTEGNACQGFP